MAQPKTIEGREYTKFVDSPSRPNSSAVEGVIYNDVKFINVSPFGEFNKIEVAYPTNVREVYTYSLDSNVIGSVTVDYTDASKKLLSVVIYNAV